MNPETEISYNFYLLLKIVFLLLFAFKYVKIILSLWIEQKWTAGQVWPVGHCLLTADSTDYLRISETMKNTNVLALCKT